MSLPLTGLRFLAQDYRQFVNALSSVERSLKSTVNSISQTAESFNNFSRSSVSFGSSLVKNIGDSAINVSKKMFELVDSVTSLSISFESAFTSVSKTVDGLASLDDKGFIQLSESGIKLESNLRELSNTTSSTFEELSNIAALGGQLGITRNLDTEQATAALTQFSSVIAGLNASTNLSADNAATSLARISNIYTGTYDNIGQNIENLGNSIVRLGNNFAANETEIVNFATRIAGAGKIVGATQADILGISAAFTSVGIKAEAGGTSVSDAFTKMLEASNSLKSGFVDNTEEIDNLESKIQFLNGSLETLQYKTGVTGQSMVDQKQAFLDAGGSVIEFGRLLGDTGRRNLLKTQEEINNLTQELNKLTSTQGKAFVVGSEALNEFARVSGLTSKQFVELFEKDATEAFTLFVEGLGKEGNNATQVLDKVGLDGARSARAFLSMAEAGDLLTEAITESNKEFEDGSALADEIAIRYAILELRIAKFTNNVRNLGAEFGAKLNPVFARFIDLLTNAVQSLKTNFLDTFIQSLNVLPTVFDSIVLEMSYTIGLLSKSFTEIFGNVPFELSFIKREIVSLFNFITGKEVDLSIGMEDIGDIKNIKDVISAPFEFDVSPFFDKINTFIKSINFESVGESIALVIEKLLTFFDSIRANIENIKLSFTILGNILQRLGLTLVFSALATALTALLSPLGLLILSITLFTVAYEKNFFGIQEITDSISNFISEKIANIVEKFNTLKEAFDVGGLPNLLQELGFSEEQSGTIINTLSNISEKITSFKDTIVTFLDTLKTKGLAEALKELGIPEEVFEVFDVFKTKILDVFDEKLPKIKESFNKLGESISNLLSGEGFTKISEFFSTLAISIKDFALNNADGISSFFSTLLAMNFDAFDSIINFLSNFIDTINGLISADKELLGSGLSGMYDTIISLLMSPFVNFSEQFKDIDLFGFVKDAANVALTNLLSLIDFGLPIFTTVLEFFNEKVTELQNYFLDFFPNIDLGLPSFFDVLTFFSEQVINISNYFSNLLSEIDLGEFDFSIILSKIQEYVVSFVSSFTNLLPNIDLGLPNFSEILTTVSNVVSEITGIFTNIFENISFSLPDFFGGGGDGLLSGFVLPEIDFTSLLNMVIGLTQEIPKFIEVLIGLFENLSANIIPSFQNWINSFILLNTEVFPTFYSQIINLILPSFTILNEFIIINLIPTFNNLIETIRLLITEFNNLITIINDVITNFNSLISIQKSEKSIAEDLTEIILKLAEAYRELGDAIASLPDTPPGIPSTPTAPNVPSFAKGGDFIVPNVIPKSLQGFTGGMLIEVHPRERVTVSNHTKPVNLQKTLFVNNTTANTSNSQNNTRNVSIRNLSFNNVGQSKRQIKTTLDLLKATI